MSVSSPAVERVPLVELRTRAGLCCLVGGAVALFLGRLTTTPGGNPHERLEQMSGHDVSITVSALLVVVGFAALMAGLLTVAAEVRGRGSAAATVGGGLTVACGIGFAVLASVDLVTLAATHVQPADAMAAFLAELDHSPGILVVTVAAMVGYLVGPFLVALAVARAGAAARWLPWAVLLVLVLQPVAAGAGGPAVARTVDAVVQLALVALMVLLARSTLTLHRRSA